MTGIRNPIVEIIAVGSELLTPYYQDTNSLHLTEKLNCLGLNVAYKSIVGDNWHDLVQSFKIARARADIIIATGGLGPTQDDRTREACAASLDRDLSLQEDLLFKITERFRKRGLAMPAVNEKQACVIAGAVVLANENGTAPGLWIEDEQKIFILLPGPPNEAFPIFELDVLPRLEKYGHGYRENTVLKISGLTESKIETLITDLHPQGSDLSLTILAKPGQIEIHITGYSPISRAAAKNKVDRLKSRLQERLKLNIFSTDSTELEGIVGQLLLGNNKTLATAESCTGGLLGDRITDVPGSSAYYLLGMHVYSNEAKSSILGIPSEMIVQHGAVSRQVAENMAYSIRKKAGADFGLGITGIAGPGGGTAAKPVGLVYTSLSWKGGIKVKKNIFLGNRKIVKFRASQESLDMLRLFLLSTNVAAEDQAE